MAPTNEKMAKPRKGLDSTATKAIKGKRGRKGTWNVLQEVALEGAVETFRGYLEDRDFQGGSQRIKGDDGTTVNEYIDKTVDGLFGTATFSAIPNNMTLESFRTVSSLPSLSMLLLSIRTECEGEVRQHNSGVSEGPPCHSEDRGLGVAERLPDNSEDRGLRIQGSQ
jgi:hypothetical protein